MKLNNTHRWLLAIGLPILIGILESIEEGKDIATALRHSVHTLIPTLTALQLTLDKGGNGNVQPPTN
jgi:hypothetical protein